MKKLALFIAVLLTIFSCMRAKNCNNKSHYLVRIDTLKEFSIKGKYCFNVLEKNTQTDSCLIKINVFSRIGGRKINDGVYAIVKNDTNRLSFSETPILKRIKKTNFRLWIGGDNCDYLYTPEIKIENSSIIEFNIYLGQTLQF